MKLKTLPCWFGFHGGKWSEVKNESWRKYKANGTKYYDFAKYMQTRTCPDCGLVDKQYLTGD
jgi:hypothetical protein